MPGELATPASNILTVTRTVLNDPRSLLLKLVEAESTREEIDEAIALVQNGKCDYSGIYFKNHFRVNRPIKLVDVAFYGPYEEPTADYTAHVQIYKPRKPKAVFPDSNGFRIASRHSLVANVKNRELFHVGFLEPVHIQPHIWHLIEFRLDGPPTLRSSDTLDSVKVRVPSASSTANETSVDFQFRLGSKQMPCLRFKLA